MRPGYDRWTTSVENMPSAFSRALPHKPARALFWVSPAGKLEALFETLHDMTDIPAFIEASARHDVDFLPPEANA